MTALSLLAPAKINLALEVIGRRPDGYHEIQSVVQTIALADELTFAPAKQLEIAIEGAAVPPEEDLVRRAAELARATWQVQQGARITTRKRIPLAAGLGGGSSDAAATLRGLAALWGIRTATRTLVDLAARLGSDVPALVHGGTTLVSGRGEVVEPLPGPPRTWLVLVPRSWHEPAKTARLYGLLASADFTSGEHVRELALRLRAGERPRDELLVNAFDRPARSFFPGLADLWTAVESATGTRFHLAGAGPTLFSIHSTRAEAQRCRRLAARVAPAALVTHTTGPNRPARLRKRADPCL